MMARFDRDAKKRKSKPFHGLDADERAVMTLLARRLQPTATVTDRRAPDRKAARSRAAARAA